ncbi:MAG TPA: ABC transporter ATP-binding protein [bacterium]|nr:ABC transporter ATP-binding protein [bacterium]
MNLLEVRDLRTRFFCEEGVVKAVDGVDLTVRRGEILGLVGETGCGKSAIALSIMSLLDPPGRVVGGSIRLGGINLLGLPEAEMAKIRGNRVAMIFQQPQSSLDPVFKVGQHIVEAIRVHRAVPKCEAWRQAVELLREAGIPDPERLAHAYPHELSGGMAQRVMIAIALACRPDLVIADEPTTALDVTIQAQILDLLRSLRSRFGMAVIVITHDLGVIAEVADRVAVMYAGRIVEQTNVRSLFSEPRHPYTRGLIECMPRLDEVRDRLVVIPGAVPTLTDTAPGCRFASRCQARVLHNMSRCTELEPPLEAVSQGHEVRCWLYDRAAVVKPELPEAPGSSADCRPGLGALANGSSAARVSADRDSLVHPLLSVTDLFKRFPTSNGVFRRGGGTVRAVDGVSFEIREGETLALVGESGCGKTTVGRAILRLIPSTSGTVLFDGQDVLRANRTQLKALRRQMQIIFQDPSSSLDPRMQVGDSIGLGLLVNGVRGKERDAAVIATLRKVGLEPYHARRYPRELSGGQRQRIVIARALALRPKFIVCDEPVSALDVSVQSQILNLLRDLQEELRLSYLFIAHNLSVVNHIANRVAVMYLGKIVELADREELFRNPLHPYTRALMSAVPSTQPSAGRTRTVLNGDLPSQRNVPSGCRFHTRCPLAQARCAREEPMLKQVTPGHTAACWLV